MWCVSKSRSVVFHGMHITPLCPTSQHFAPLLPHFHPTCYPQDIEERKRTIVQFSISCISNARTKRDTTRCAQSSHRWGTTRRAQGFRPCCERDLKRLCTGRRERQTRLRAAGPWRPDELRAAVAERSRVPTPAASREGGTMGPSREKEPPCSSWRTP